MQDQQQDAAVRGAESIRGAGSARGDALYVRPMPGGGTVRVELQIERRPDRPRPIRRGRLVMESRPALWGEGRSEPLVLEEMEGDDENAIVDALFRIARDNAAIARLLMRRQAQVPRAD